MRRTDAAPGPRAPACVQRIRVDAALPLFALWRSQQVYFGLTDHGWALPCGLSMAGADVTGVVVSKSFKVQLTGCVLVT